MKDFWTVIHMELLLFRRGRLSWLLAIFMVLWGLFLVSAAIRFTAYNAWFHFGISYFVLTLLLTFLTGNQIQRDREQRLDSVVWSTPMATGVYVCGKYVATLLLVVGFYVLGAAAAPPNRAMGRYGFDPAQLEKALLKEISAISGRVPPEVIVRIQRIEFIMRTQVLPGIDCLPSGSLELYLIERTARDYLPTAVENYLRLPGGYVSTQPGSRGSIPIQVLIDELNLLEAQMRRVADVVHRADMDRLLAHRRFLNDRFSGADVSH